ncbi:MAG: hypothetical protein N2Z74_04410 [Syntrophales bacterium]|nr:hypothetical protein [Syntrophales bacterium]
MTPEMMAKLDAVLQRVKDPESGLSIGALGLVKRFRYDEAQGKIYVFLDTYRHLPKCVTCAAIAQTVIAGIVRDLKAEMAVEFPDLTTEFV